MVSPLWNVDVNVLGSYFWSCLGCQDLAQIEVSHRAAKHSITSDVWKEILDQSFRGFTIADMSVPTAACDNQQRHQKYINHLKRLACALQDQTNFGQWVVDLSSLKRARQLAATVLSARSFLKQHQEQDVSKSRFGQTFVVELDFPHAESLFLHGASEDHARELMRSTFLESKPLHCFVASRQQKPALSFTFCFCIAFLGGDLYVKVQSLGIAPLAHDCSPHQDVGCELDDAPQFINVAMQHVSTPSTISAHAYVGTNGRFYKAAGQVNTYLVNLDILEQFMMVVSVWE